MKPNKPTDIDSPKKARIHICQIWQISTKDLTQILDMQEKKDAVWDFLDATLILERFLHTDHIPDVIRRTSPMFANMSMLDFARTAPVEDFTNRITAMFDIARVQP